MQKSYIIRRLERRLITIHVHLQVRLTTFASGTWVNRNTLKETMEHPRGTLIMPFSLEHGIHSFIMQ